MGGKEVFIVEWRVIRGRAVREPPLREKERAHGERFLDSASLGMTSS